MIDNSIMNQILVRNSDLSEYDSVKGNIILNIAIMILVRKGQVKIIMADKEYVLSQGQELFVLPRFFYENYWQIRRFRSLYNFVWGEDIFF